MTRAADTSSKTRGPLDPRVLGLAPALRVHLAVCAAIAVAVAAGVLAQAEAFGRLLPRLVDGDGSAARPLAAWLVGAALVRGLAAGLTERSATRALIATRTRVRQQVLDQVARLRPDQRPALGPARASALTTTALDALEPWVRSYLPGLVLAVVVPLAAGARILGADPASALILAVVIPLIPIFMVLIGKFTESQAERQWEALQRLAGRFLDVLTGLPTLRLFGRADAQVARVREVTDRYRQATLRTLRVAFLSALVLELLATVSVALVAVSLGVRLTRGGVGLETALVVLLLTPECLLPIRRVGAAFHAATAGLDAAQEITAALDLPVRAEGTAPVPTGHLVAHGLSLVDPARGSRLAAVDLDVAPGEFVALHGPSGAGKSTLLDVLRGALAPSTGTITLGGTAVGTIPLAERAAALRWVPQAPEALGQRVRASAAIGTGQAETSTMVADTLDLLGLAELADADPTEISGGELRRLAVARAVVASQGGAAQFLLVDEPTAQLDEAAARAVIDALRVAANHGVGVVVVTHDPVVVDAADRAVAIAGDTPSASHTPPASTAVAHRRRKPIEVLPFAEPASHLARPALAGDAPAAAAAPRAGAVRWVLELARPHRLRLIGAQALGVLTEACTVGLAATAAWLIVRAAEQPSFADLAVAAVGVRAFGLGKGPLRYVERLTSHDASLRLLADLRSRVVARLVHLSPTGFPEGGRGEVLGRMVDDIDRLQDLFLRVLGPALATSIVAVAAGVATLTIDPGAGAALLVGSVVTGGLLPVLAYRGARVRWSTAAHARGRVTAITVDLAEHAEELVACGGEPEWRARIEDATAVVDALERRQARTTALVAAAAGAAPAAVAAAVVLATGPAGSGLSGPMLGVIALLPLAVIDLLAPLSTSGEVLAKVEASAVRVRTLMDRPDPVTEPAVPAPLPTAATVELSDVAIGWPDAPTQVSGITLTVAEGATAVVTGPSGSGKSTLAATLVRFLAPTSGTYRVGGTDAAALGGEGVRQLVTWCQQVPWFADSTLADNLRVARPSATDDELWSVLDVVHLRAWAEALPDGLRTRLERDASAMSGGERQRLALARALLGGHRAIVFDEPTAHLDQETAQAVLADLLAATADRAVVVIAHGDTDALRDIGPVHHLVAQTQGPSRWIPAEAGSDL